MKTIEDLMTIFLVMFILTCFAAVTIVPWSIGLVILLNRMFGGF